MCLGGFGWQVVKKIREILDDTITDFVLNHREVLNWFPMSRLFCDSFQAQNDMAPTVLLRSRTYS